MNASTLNSGNIYHIRSTKASPKGLQQTSASVSPDNLLPEPLLKEETEKVQKLSKEIIQALHKGNTNYNVSATHFMLPKKAEAIVVTGSLAWETYLIEPVLDPTAKERFLNQLAERSNFEITA
jgi:hypothetical protein